MIKQLPKPIIFAFAALMGLVLYWPSMGGTPIWDDYSNWFNDPVMMSDFSYLTIWKDFGWPFSVSFQKLLLAIFKDNFKAYHFISFSFHFLNSYLIYELARKLEIKYSLWLFFLFFFHPACVISVAWMIQLKTIICLTFILSSCLCLFKTDKNKKWIYLSYLLFFLSVASKSSSIPAILIFLLFTWKTAKGREWLYFLPFLLIASWGTYKLFKSSLTQEGIKTATTVTQSVTTPKPIPVQTVQPKPVITQRVEPKVEKPRPIPKNKMPKPYVPKHLQKSAPKPVILTPAIDPEIYRRRVVEPPKLEPPKGPISYPDTIHPEKSFLDFKLVTQTLHYYFWQSVFPINNVPVKGLNPETPGYDEYIHLVFLGFLIFIFWKSTLIWYFVLGHLLLLPYLGLIPAPFMIITWVSDQHLYLVVPVFMAMWLKLLEKIPSKYALVIPAVLLLFYVGKTRQASAYYKEQIVFYEVSLESNPINLAISYNLAFAYLSQGRWMDAYNVISSVCQLAEMEPYIKKAPFYPQVRSVYLQMQTSMEKK